MTTLLPYIVLVAMIAIQYELAIAGPVAATVTVDAADTLFTIPATQEGVNTAVWDGYLTDSNTVPLLQTAGIKMLRYPGGSESDAYHWLTNIGVQDGGVTYWGSSDAFDPFMTLVANPLGAMPIITVNYGSNSTNTGGGDPNEAAAWVQYANITKNYGIKYWEIGNEVYGNGYYGDPGWEYDLHYDAFNGNRTGQAALSPTTYGQNVVLYANAMKAIDPTIKIGVVLDLPGSYYGSLQDWNANVLQQCGTKIDFVILHWYPEYVNDNDSVLLNYPSQIAGFMGSIKGLINQYCGGNAANIQTMITETNSDASPPGKQMLSAVNALFTADDIETWLENGASNVDYWDLRNGASDGDDDSSLFGTLQYGDEGILSNGSSTALSNGTYVTEPPVDTPFSSYYALQMIHELGSPGDIMVSSSSNQTLLTTHAVRRADGSLAVLLINKSPADTFNASLNLSSFKPAWQSTRYTYDSTTTNLLPASSYTPVNPVVSVGPYSMETIALNSQAANVPSHLFPAGIQMISIPCDFSSVDPDTVLSPITAMADWSPSAQGYSVLPNAPADAYRAGSGYWIRAPAGGSFVAATTGTTPGATTTVTIGAGWNIVGNPYTSPEPESGIQVQVGSNAPESLAQAVTDGIISGTLYTYSAGSSAYTSQSASAPLQPYAGYWLQATQNCTLTYTAPS